MTKTGDTDNNMDSFLIFEDSLIFWFASGFVKFLAFILQICVNLKIHCVIVLDYNVISR